MVTSTCTEENLVVETAKGKYTIPTDDYVFGFCAAQKSCARRGAVLAPIKERSEFDAVMEAIKSCEFQDKVVLKIVGLQISDDNSTRVFTDGVKFDYDVHGDVYQENDVGIPQNCPAAFLDPERTNKLQIGINWGCGTPERLFICFEPVKATKFDAITSDAASVNTGFFVAAGSVLFVAVVCLVSYLVRQNKNLKLKLQQTSNGV